MTKLKQWLAWGIVGLWVAMAVFTTSWLIALYFGWAATLLVFVGAVALVGMLAWAILTIAEEASN